MRCLSISDARGKPPLIKDRQVITELTSLLFLCQCLGVTALGWAAGKLVSKLGMCTIIPPICLKKLASKELSVLPGLKFHL